MLFQARLRLGTGVGIRDIDLHCVGETRSSVAKNGSPSEANSKPSPIKIGAGFGDDDDAML